jgi:phage tail-like protein
MLDANGTRHHLVLGERDWILLSEVSPDQGSLPEGSPPQAGMPTGTHYDPLRDELTLEPIPVTAPAVQTRLEQRRGVAGDGQGNVYWVDDARRSIMLQSAATGASTVFWPRDAAVRRPAPGAFGPARQAPASAEIEIGGLAVTTEDYLVAAAVAPPGILVFDLEAAGSPWQIPWSSSPRWEPFDVAPSSDGGFVVLDRSARAVYWRFDRTMRLVRSGRRGAAGAAGAFGPVSAWPGTSAGAPGPPTRDDAVRLGDDPISIATLGPWVIVLDRGADGQPSRLRVYRDGAIHGEPIALWSGGADDQQPIVAHDMILEPDAEDPSRARFYVASATTAEAFEFILELKNGSASARSTDRDIPMRSFGGRGLASGPVYDSGSRWIPLAAQPPGPFVQSATIVTRSFDGHEPGCVWHRLMLDAVLPPRGSVQIWSRAADDETAALPVAAFAPEPDPAPRPDGSEQPYVTLPAGWCTYETLFQQCRGRYLQLMLVIAGDGRSSPRLRAVRIYYPRFSYLRKYLPKLYQDDLVSASFLDRYLANVEGINTTIEDRIAAAQALLDARSVPPDALDWLASFFDVSLDPAWPEAGRRLFVEHAMDFFRWRGTARGLQIALSLALDPQVDETTFADPPNARTQRYRVVELFATAPGGGDQTGNAEQTRPVIGQQWTRFLAARYRRVSALNRAYGTGAGPYHEFAAVPSPEQASSTAQARADWTQFASLVQRASDRAHRFVVLLPVPDAARMRSDEVDPSGGLQLATRLIELNKPAHTQFDVRYYWAAFQVGSAVLEHDTAIDVGSRAPQLRVPARVGESYAGSAYLSGPPAERLTSPPAIGRGATLTPDDRRET